METFSSKLLQTAVEEFSRLPGIGRKTALRLVLHLLKQDPETVGRFSNAIGQLHREVVYCKECCNISDRPVCELCSSPRRDKSMICVVEDLRDVIAIENTGQYHGLYHVLGGIISPIDGIGPDDLSISHLENRLQNNSEVKEVILALSTTMEGDTTNFYLYKRIKPFDIKVSVIARGIAIGDELEYADEITLGRSIVYRTAYESTTLR
ncbi:MAG: recombination mediator RecR [Bacteroidales bacterium]|nr:recombination mediator RecR [Bacteroidales bacterium]